MSRLFPSLRSRLQVLGILVFLLLVGSAIAFGLLLRNNETQILSQTAVRLSATVSVLAHDYVNRAQFQGSGGDAPALNNPQAPGSDDTLSLMTSLVLRREVGTEGGFYSRTGDMLMGYAFPTHEGPGVKKEMPQKELPTIIELARKAATTGVIQSYIFKGDRDAIVFEAAPVTINGQTIGSTWVMKRLPGLHSERTWRTYAGGLLFGIAACLCVVMAFLIARNLQLGVSLVEKRLRDLEWDLSAPATHVSGIREIEQINAGLNRMAATLHQKIGQEQEMQQQLRHSERLAALGKVAAGVAHELRNPLSTIRLRAQMNLRGADPETIRKSSSITIEEINRLDHMVERLLYFTRPMKLDIEQVDVLTVAKTSAERARTAAQRAGVVISIQPEGNPLITDADESALRQVFDNLISNAVESLDAGGGSVTIAGSREEDAVLVVVSDTGSGISPDDLTRIFDPFFTTKAHGTGLGLSISYEIVKAHQGNLRVSSKLGEGTTIIVSLPCTTQAAANDRPMATSEVPQ